MCAPCYPYVNPFGIRPSECIRMPRMANGYRATLANYIGWLCSQCSPESIRIELTYVWRKVIADIWITWISYAVTVIFCLRNPWLFIKWNECSAHANCFPFTYRCVQQELFLLCHSNIDWRGIRRRPRGSLLQWYRVSEVQFPVPIENCAKTPAFCVRLFLQRTLNAICLLLSL